jgi:hypothetical protein
MSAAEIIELIKKLPPEEKAVVIAFAREEDRTGVRNADPERAAGVAQGVFDRHPELFRNLAQSDGHRSRGRFPAAERLYRSG